MKDTVIEKISMKRPHLVIIGAGASFAALPDGDKNGRKLPLMKNFVEILNLHELLKSIKVEDVNINFEEIYNDLVESKKYPEIIKEIEQRIYDYFDSIEILEKPTIYDFMLLSLRSKDVIASFNWDPLLLQAYFRCSRITEKLPKILFLHGNVLAGVCEDCKRGGLLHIPCPNCNKKFSPTKLLYPVKQKDYENNMFIRDQWNVVKQYWAQAFSVTVFGYSAPVSDAGAIKLFSDGWGDKEKRALEQIEIINTRSEDEILKSWDKFIHTHHYSIHRSFFDSTLAKFPRRSNEAFWDMHMECKFLDPHPFTQDMSWKDIMQHVDGLTKYE